MSDEIKGMEFRQAVYDALKAGKEYSKKDAERVCTWLILTTDGLSFPMKPDIRRAIMSGRAEAFLEASRPMEAQHND